MNIYKQFLVLMVMVIITASIGSTNSQKTTKSQVKTKEMVKTLDKLIKDAKRIKLQLKLRQRK
jgi:hypothetical protein